MLHDQPDRRSEPRLRSLLGATLRFRHTATITDCLIRDITANGARIAVDETIPLSAVFEITIPHLDDVRHARLVWRHGDWVGVAFEASEPEGSVVPIEVARELRATKAENAALQARIASLEAMA